MIENVFVGTCPVSGSDARRLASALGVTAVLNLQTDEDFARWGIDWTALQRDYLALGIAIERLPIRDFDVEDLKLRVVPAADRLARLLDIGHRVYVHCTAGQQRAPATVISYLVVERGYSLDEALAEFAARRYCTPNVDALREILEGHPTDGGTKHEEDN